MANESRELARYAAGLRFDDIPAAVIQRAKDCIADTIATIAYGGRLPWSRIVLDYANRTGSGGSSRVLDMGGGRLRAPQAAFANGALAHAFELDNLTWPNSGVHPGATMLVPALAVAQERRLSGRALLTAFVAGAETMIRIGRATHHNNETRGFHAPGTTGPFGGAIAAGKLIGLDADRMLNALGIAGSTASGLLEFARSGTGAMVKRLHMGRAAESGVMSASLAEQGFTGPQTVLEGPFGFLKVYCGEYAIEELTKGLGRDYATLRILLKRFPCHITSHTPVQGIQDLLATHRYKPADVAGIHVEGTPKMATINNIPNPSDLMMAQYSLPFNVALAHYREARDPRSYDAKAFNDPAIRALMARVTVSVAEDNKQGHSLAANVTVTLNNGRKLTQRVEHFKGTPELPLDSTEMRDKFLLLLRDSDQRGVSRLFDRIQNLEAERNLDWIKVPARGKAAAKSPGKARAKTVTRSNGKRPKAA